MTCAVDLVLFTTVLCHVDHIQPITKFDMISQRTIYNESTTTENYSSLGTVPTRISTAPRSKAFSNTAILF
jgi:hypothetical protein